MKKLYLSNSDKIIGGVCGGVAEYFEIDPTLIRLIAVIATVLTGFVGGIIIYIVAMIIIPKDLSFNKDCFFIKIYDCLLNRNYCRILS